MAGWVTHLSIADKIMKKQNRLDRRGFCVGNIAPDCNVENEDWTSFTPSKKITHWMSNEIKTASDCDLFCDEYILNRYDKIKSNEEYSFLLGYYAHLITDAAYQGFIRDEKRVKALWDRIEADIYWKEKAKGCPRDDWASLKKIIPRDLRDKEMYEMEAEYLRDNPDSGFLTEIIPLKEFPDYIDYLPHGCIVRKIGIMGWIPEVDENMANLISMTREEYNSFIEDTVRLVQDKFTEKELFDKISRFC